MTPVAALLHLLAVVVGVFGGFTIMAAITPDPPPRETTPEAYAGDDVLPEDPESLFAPDRFAEALERLEEEYAGSGIVVLHVEPGVATVATAAPQEGLLDLGAVPPDELQRLVGVLQRERPQLELDDIRFFELVAAADGPTWYVQLDSVSTVLSPPWAYEVRLGGKRVLGSEMPEPIVAPEEG
ncbi:MAG TPA: hypothetical protein VIL04_06290 [Solirubrobacterales bacterium]